MNTPAALVLRPEPGNAATCARLLAAGIAPVGLPLFGARALPWTPPDPDGFDAVLLTSANAARLGGEGLRTLAHLPALAVGAATAAAARAAGLDVAMTGDGDAAHLAAAARAAGYARPVHLAGRDHRPTGAAAIPVYASEPLPVARGALAQALSAGATALLHSPRAARRFAGLVDAGRISRARVAIAALSPAVLAAADDGWGWGGAAATPDDDALVALVRRRLTAASHMGISGA